MQIYLWQLLIGTRNWGNETVYQDKDVLTLLFNALFLVGWYWISALSRGGVEKGGKWSENE